jgi:hypothetical protein
MNQITLPSKKFYVFFGLFAIGGLFFFFSFVKPEMDSKKQKELTEVKAQSGDTLVGKTFADIVKSTDATSTLLKKALYFDTIQEKGGSPIVNAAVSEMGAKIKNDKEKMVENKYTLQDIQTKKDNSKEALRAYGNALVKIYIGDGSKPSMGELDAVREGIGNKNKAALSVLDEYIAFYKETIASCLAMKVPSVAADIHLETINAFATLLAVDQGYRNAYDTPSSAFAGLYGQQEASKKFLDSLKKTSDFFHEKGIVFTQQENGYMFTLMYQKI